MQDIIDKKIEEFDERVTSKDLIPLYVRGEKVLPIIHSFIRQALSSIRTETAREIVEMVGKMPEDESCNMFNHLNRDNLTHKLTQKYLTD